MLKAKDLIAKIGLYSFTAIFFGLLAVTLLEFSFGTSLLDRFQVFIDVYFLTSSLLFVICICTLWIWAWYWLIRSWRLREDIINLGWLTLLALAPMFAGYIIYFIDRKMKQK
jgi:hypothetical protein